ncbi:MAG: hypothetical protein Q9214_004117, partial [Letrouitia sp. 1 TL-2023]
MKFISILTAVLSFEAALAIPFGEERSGSGLVRRGGNNRGSSRDRGKEKTKKKLLPGTSGRERYSPQAPAANQRESIERMVDEADSYHARHRGSYDRIEVTSSPPRGSRKGKTYVYDTQDDDGALVTVGMQGTDRARDHAVAARDHEDRDPSYRKARYKPESEEAKRNKRGKTIKDIKAIDLRPRGNGDPRKHMKEENPKASNRLVPANRRDPKVGIPPVHVYDAARSTSDHQDSPLAAATNRRAKERGSDIRYRSNLDERTEREYQEKKVSAKPLRGLKKDGMPDPMWIQTRDDTQDYGYSDGLVSRSSASPRDRGSPQYRVRSPRRRRRRDSDDDRKKVKRDVVDKATKHQSNADSKSKEGQQTDNKQIYQDLMQ